MSVYLIKTTTPLNEVEPRIGMNHHSTTDPLALHVMLDGRFLWTAAVNRGDMVSW